VSWTWSRELFKTVGGPLNIELPATVITRVKRLLDEALVSWNGGLRLQEISINHDTLDDIRG
jgi:hypothetical protein